MSAPDQPERDRAVAARDQTVLIDAGAGAGKTTILVTRIIAMIAPLDDAAPAMSLLRIAAVTFTRRAAGELRLRVRELLLKELATRRAREIRKRRLLDALGSVDAAALGTIHGFADRLLRLQPMKARLSPAYRIADDTSAFIDETLDLLLHAVQNGTLASEARAGPGQGPTWSRSSARSRRCCAPGSSYALLSAIQHRRRSVSTSSCKGSSTTVTASSTGKGPVSSTSPRSSLQPTTSSLC